MEREYTFGALMVLILLFVIGIIVLVTYPGITKDISKIADEVFGITKGALEETKRDYEEYVVSNNFDKIVAAFACAKAKCACNLDLEPFSEDYKLKIEDFKGAKKLLIEGSEGVVLKVKELGEINICFMQSPSEKKDLMRDYGVNELVFDWDGEKISPPRKKLMEFTNVYKFDDKNICFVTEETQNKEFFQNLKDCQTGNREAREAAKAILSEFEKKYRYCKSQEHKIDYCRCSFMDFKDLPEFHSIKVEQDKENTTISLMYKTLTLRPPKTPEVKITDNIFGELVKIGELKREPEYIFNQDSKIYLLQEKSNETIPFAKESLGKNFKPCSITYVLQDNCKRKLDPINIWKRIETTKYGAKTYKEIIEESTTDKNLRVLAAAVMATESAAINEAKSLTGCKGLMQFCGSTAQNFKIPCGDKLCYVCRPEGENPCKEDNREKPSIAIPAGIKLIEQKIGYFQKYTYKEQFGLAAYNGGEAVIASAIKKTGKENPDWETVKKQISRDVLKRYSPYKTWPDSDLDKKIAEISCYPYYANEYKIAFEGYFS